MRIKRVGENNYYLGVTGAMETVVIPFHTVRWEFWNWDGEPFLFADDGSMLVLDTVNMLCHMMWRDPLSVSTSSITKLERTQADHMPGTHRAQVTLRMEPVKQLRDTLVPSPISEELFKRLREIAGDDVYALSRVQEFAQLVES